MESQLDVFRDDPSRLAQVWRDAAEASRQQFPDDQQRYDYYIREAQRYERVATD